MPSKPPAKSDPVPSILALRRVKLLEGLSDDTLATFARTWAWRRFKPNQQIITREARDTSVYIIVSGVVRITAFSGGGRQVTYRDMEAGEWFGDLAAIDGKPRSADALARTETLVVVLTPEQFRQLVFENPPVCDRLLRHITAWVRDLTDRLFDLSTLGVRNRVHAEILRLARQASSTANSARIQPAPKHVEIASQVSTYREQVTRELSAMARAGLIKRDGAALVVPDVARLERIVAEVRRAA